jgi:hypothetical protein
MGKMNKARVAEAVRGIHPFKDILSSCNVLRLENGRSNICEYMASTRNGLVVTNQKTTPLAVGVILIIWFSEYEA